MKLLKHLLLIVLLIAGAAACFGQAYMLSFYPTYWITGTVNDAPDGKSANGYKVYFYHTIPEYNTGSYAFDTVGTTGGSGRANRFMINTFSLGISSLTVGGTYYVGIPNDNPSNPAEGYGADPVAVVISGHGVDEITTALSLTKGKGAMLPPPPAPGAPGAPPVVEPSPSVKITFGNRLYQPGIYWVKEKGDKPFIVSAKPEIKVDLSIPSPFTLAGLIEAHSLVIDAGTPGSKTLTLTASNVTGKTYAAGTTAEENKITSMSLKYLFEEELSEGKHTLSVTSRSSGAMGIASAVTEIATVEVMGGPLRVLGIPITFPSPFSITKHGTVTIQYELSKDGNITVYLMSPTGEIIKRWNFDAGTEGGSAGINKISWDGRSDQGYLAGNAIYLGSIISRDENRKLATFKLTIVD